jgi:hypothetical protein
LREALRIPTQHWREFLEPLALPALAIAALTLGSQLARNQMPAMAGWVILAFYGAVLTVLAVACHRLVLLGPTASTLKPALRWGARESKFFGRLLVLGVIYAVVHLAVVLLILNLGTLPSLVRMMSGQVRSSSPDMGWLRPAEYFGLLISTYFVARLSLVLPATALDAKTGLRQAWRQSARNGWRLLVIVGAFPWVLTRVLELLYRADATLAESAILILLSVLVSTLGIIALSLSYQDLTGTANGADQSRSA